MSAELNNLNFGNTLKIVIDAIDIASYRPCGYSELPSFIVQFHSLAIRGTARLVPASGMADALPDDEFIVELDHESATDFNAIAGMVKPSVACAMVPGDFKVIGEICFLDTAANGAMCRACIAVGDAVFALTQEEMGGVSPNIGTMVEFVAHEVSMWDEAI